MKYVSIDIETSGLDAEKNQVLSIGAIIEDTEKKLPFLEIPRFNAIILHREIVGSPRALGMNKSIIETMGQYLEADDKTREMFKLAQTGIYGGGYSFFDPEEVVAEFYRFLFANGFEYDLGPGGFVNTINGVVFPAIGSQTKPITINVAGKNFGTFDKLFLEKLPWWKKLIRTRQRVLDPAILFVDWKNDSSLPSLTQCKERAGIEGIVTHNALEDAWDVIETLRKNY
jgi:hypothetical protein